jgi:murein DD-endopeptidase MepM/ murein hydrolase activator NlpD
VDRQVHLGFDLAVTANVPIKAAQKGVVVHAAYLGIYGNCVVIDHGMGVQSLYGHLSSIGVKVGDRVDKGRSSAQRHDRAGGGDHLHFTMLGRRPAGDAGRLVEPAVDGGPRPRKIKARAARVLAAAQSSVRRGAPSGAPAGGPDRFQGPQRRPWDNRALSTFRSGPA